MFGGIKFFAFLKSHKILAVKGAMGEARVIILQASVLDKKINFIFCWFSHFIYEL